MSSFLVFILAALLGFYFGSKQHLKRVGAVMLQLKMDPQEVDRVRCFFFCDTY